MTFNHHFILFFLIIEQTDRYYKTKTYFKVPASPEMFLYEHLIVKIIVFNLIEVNILKINTTKLNLENHLIAIDKTQKLGDII